MPDIVEASFLNEAKAIMEGLSNRGSVPAGCLKRELDDLCRLASQVSRPLGVRSHLSSLRGPTSMVQDGLVLNQALLNVIELSIPNEYGRHQNHEDISVQGVTTSTHVENTNQNDPWNSSIPPVGDRSLYLNDTYISDLATGEGAFTFDTVDLQWLESV